MNAAQKQSKGMLPVFLLIVVLLIVALVVNMCRKGSAPAPIPRRESRVQPQARGARPETGLVRRPSHISYSRHARCRMACRHITETEVKEILANGTINYRKSELNTTDCSKRYAVEGNTHDNQRVRIIFAPCNTEETVVTVIDLGKEWSCDCK